MVSSDELELYNILEGLHSHWTPHDVQIEIGHALFYKGIKNIFVCAGRNLGKTETAAYCSWRYGQQVPGSQSYIFEPFQKQGREILWASRRIQEFGPKDWIRGEPNNTEMRITFTNDSFVKIEGSDNVAAIAGIKPKGLIVYDEFKNHRIASIKNFEPNRAAFDVPALFIGTPPEFHNHFVDYMEMAKNSPDWLFIHAPTSRNPHISKSWLDKMKTQMFSMGQEEDWYREYEALFVKGGKKTIYPQFLKLNFKLLDEVIPVDLYKWTLVVGLDPGSTSVFAVCFSFFNPYTKQIIVFDEIYQTDPILCTAREINKQINEKIKPWKDKVKTIEYVIDEAGVWAKLELNEVAPEKWITSSQKSRFGVEGYINLIRGVLNAELLTVTKNCKWFIKEHEEYSKDDNGRIPKRDDHLINAFQYLCGYLGLNLDSINEPKKVEEMHRGYRPEDDLDLFNTSFKEFD